MKVVPETSAGEREANAKLSKNRIYIVDQHDRWVELTDVLRVETNAEVARILFDRYVSQIDEKWKWK